MERLINISCNMSNKAIGQERLDNLSSGQKKICPIMICLNYISQCVAVVCRLDSLSNWTGVFTLDRQRVPLGTLLSSPFEGRREESGLPVEDLLAETVQDVRAVSGG